MQRLARWSLKGPRRTDPGTFALAPERSGKQLGNGIPVAY